MSKHKSAAECNEEELQAIANWYDGADPSNFPDDTNKVKWSFTRDRKTGKLKAGYLAGYII